MPKRARPRERPRGPSTVTDTEEERKERRQRWEPAGLQTTPLEAGQIPTGPNLQRRSFILYWMLCATPLPRFATLLPPEMPQFPVANAFGTLFDPIAVRHGLIRSWSATWLSWSEEHLRSLAVAFRNE